MRASALIGGRVGEEGRVGGGGVRPQAGAGLMVGEGL